MVPYKSKSEKDSGVIAYEIGSDYIKAQFVNGNTYKYTYSSAGLEAIEEMKKLATVSEGLGTYINILKPPYESMTRGRVLNV
jgi:hypothetical protein